MSDNPHPLSAAEIEKLRELEAKATPGPFWHEHYTMDEEGPVFPAEPTGDVYSGADGHEHFAVATFTRHGDADLYAAMRNALPRLLSMLQPPTDAAVREAELARERDDARDIPTIAYMSGAADWKARATRAESELERMNELWEQQRGTICQGPVCPEHQRAEKAEAERDEAVAAAHAADASIHDMAVQLKAEEVHAARMEAERDEAMGKVERLEKVMEAAEWCVEVADAYNWCMEEHGQLWFMCSPGETLDELVRSARGELIAALSGC